MEAREGFGQPLQLDSTAAPLKGKKSGTPAQKKNIAIEIGDPRDDMGEDTSAIAPKDGGGDFEEVQRASSTTGQKNEAPYSSTTTAAGEVSKPEPALRGDTSAAIFSKFILLRRPFFDNGASLLL